MNPYQEQGELRQVIRELRDELEELLWVSYGARLSEDDLEVIEDARALLRRCKEIVGER